MNPRERASPHRSQFGTSAPERLQQRDRSLASSHPQVPILLISGYSGDKLEAMELVPGRCAFLAKPFSLGALVQQSAQLIEASRMMRSSD